MFVLMKSHSYFSDAVSIGIYRSYRNIGAVCCLHLQGVHRLSSGDEGIRNVGTHLSTQRHF
jgi:hypothetical protein